MHPDPSSSAVSARTVPLAAGGSRSLTATIDLDAVADGITCTGSGPPGRPDHLLGLDMRSSCGATDHWIRGTDVVAVYEPDDARHLRATAMWRPFPSDTAAGWEIVASAQTAIEQSDASLAVVCNVAADELLWGVHAGDGVRWQPTPPAHPDAAVAVLARRADTSVLIAGASADIRRVVARSGAGRARIECWLFSTAAEKGVLFRGRVLAAIGPASGDTAWAEPLRARHASLPPVLTT